MILRPIKVQFVGSNNFLPTATASFSYEVIDGYFEDSGVEFVAAVINFKFYTQF